MLFRSDHRGPKDGMKMRKFLSRLIAICLAAFVSAASGEDDVARSLKQLMGQCAIGRLGNGVLSYEGLTNAKVQGEYRIGSPEYDEVCRKGNCEAAWSFGEGMSWVVIRNILTNQVLVVNQEAEVQWRSTIEFELRSMLSVSRDGSTIAAVGRVNGVDSIWHVKKDGARVAWRLPRVTRSERMQVGWHAATAGNVVSDGEWTLLCEDAVGKGCRRLFAGFLPSLSPDGHMAAVRTSEETLLIYDLESSALVKRLVARAGWGGDAAKWSPDSKLIILNEMTGNGSRLAVYEIGSSKRQYARQTNGKSGARLGIINLRTRTSRTGK